MAFTEVHFSGGDKLAWRRLVVVIVVYGSFWKGVMVQDWVARRPREPTLLVEEEEDVAVERGASIDDPAPVTLASVNQCQREVKQLLRRDGFHAIGSNTCQFDGAKRQDLPLPPPQQFRHSMLSEAVF